MESTKETRALAYDILAYWERFNNHDQDDWVGRDFNPDTSISQVNVNGVEMNVCNTTLCAAGTAVFLGTPLDSFKLMARRRNDAEWQTRGGELLGLDYDESHFLFYMASEKNAKRLMRAIASGKQSKWDKAALKAGRRNEGV